MREMVSTHFIAQEFLPKETFKIYGFGGIRYINPKLIAVAELLRLKYDRPIIINDWHRGGKMNGRCLRLPNNSAFKQYSDHTFGNAIDFEVFGVSAGEVQIDCVTVFAPYLIGVGVTGMEENTSSWTHLTVSDLQYVNVKDTNGIKILKG